MQHKFSFTSIFDSISVMMKEEKQAAEKKLNAQQKSHLLEIETAVFVLTAEVIKANRNFDTATEERVREFLTKQFGKQSASKIKRINAYLETGTEPFVKMSCTVLKMLIPLDSQLHIIRYLFEVAAADDFVNAKETRAIHRAAKYLGINEIDFKRLKDSFIQQNNPYGILGIEDTASHEQVKTAYRKMVLKFHPDKRGEETSEDEANVKFRSVQRAFEKIMESK